MTDSIAVPSEATSQSRNAPLPPSKLEEVIHRLVWEIEKELWSTGEIAELRRLDPERPEGAAFWKVLVGNVEPADQLRGDDGEARWALILRSVAELYPRHKKNYRLGRALAAAGVSEMRLARLLRADLESLSTTLRAVVHQLASAAESVDLGDLAWLVVSARGKAGPHSQEDATRRRIARDYYRGLRQATEDSSPA